MNCEKENLVFETPYWKIILMDDQRYLGRFVIVLKRTCGDLAELNQEEILDFYEVIRKSEALLRKTFNATMFNWTCLMNDAYLDAVPKPQVHWHFRPRYNHLVEFAGEVFKDPNFAHHYLRAPEDERIVSQAVFGEILSTLRSGL
jgi:diadenosine tetraphosphate (Ap4A) HIT family hydrolase